MPTKKFVLLASILTVAVFSFFFFKNAMATDDIFVQADGPHLTSLTELDTYADLIVVGRPVKDFWDREHVTKRYPDGTVMDAYTLTEIKIEQILKKPTDFISGKNDTVTVVEPIGAIDGTLGKKRYIVENFYEVKQDKRYIFFLVKNSFGDYTIGNGVLGRFNLDGTDGDDIAKIEEDTEVKLKLFDEIKQKYAEQLK